MNLIDHRVPMRLNPRKERYEAVCPSCEQVIFFVSEKSIRTTGRPLPTSIPHPCKEETG